MLDDDRADSPFEVRSSETVDLVLVVQRKRRRTHHHRVEKRPPKTVRACVYKVSRFKKECLFFLSFGQPDKMFCFGFRVWYTIFFLFSFLNCSPEQ